MNKILFLLLLTLAAGNLKAQSSEECKRFHSGTFKFLGRDVVLSRTETRQYEVNQKTGEYFDCSIKWISDCEYEITIEKTNASASKGIIGKPFLIKIVSIQDNICTISFIRNDGSKGTLKIEKTEIQ